MFCQRGRMNEFFAKKMYGLRRITFDPGAGHLFCAFLAALFLPRHVHFDRNEKKNTCVLASELGHFRLFILQSAKQSCPLIKI